jgi:hypothetical protein
VLTLMRAGMKMIEVIAMIEMQVVELVEVNSVEVLAE